MLQSGYVVTSGALRFRFSPRRFCALCVCARRFCVCAFSFLRFAFCAAFCAVAFFCVFAFLRFLFCVFVFCCCVFVFAFPFSVLLCGVFAFCVLCGVFVFLCFVFVFCYPVFSFCILYFASGAVAFSFFSYAGPLFVAISVPFERVMICFTRPHTRKDVIARSPLRRIQSSGFLGCIVIIITTEILTRYRSAVISVLASAWAFLFMRHVAITSRI